MNKTLKKQLKIYLKEIKNNLNCKYYLKLGFIAKVQEDLNEYLEHLPPSDQTIENIKQNFGTAEEIARSFDRIEDISQLKRQCKILFISQFITITVSILIIVFLLVIIMKMFADGQTYIIVDKNY